METARFPLLAFCALLAGGMAIGFAGIFMRLSDVNPVASAFWRMALAAPLLWIWALQTQRPEVADSRVTGFTPVVALAGVYFACDMALWHLSLHFTSVSNATLLSNFAPIFIALWMCFVWRTHFTRIFVVGMWIALVGAALLVVPGDSVTGGGGVDHKFLGDCLGLASAVFYAAYQLVIKDARTRYSTARLMAWSTTVTSVVLLPLAVITPGPLMPVHMSGWIPLIGLALLAQIGGQTVIAYALAHLSPSLSSVSLLIQPMTATLAAWLIFAEAGGALQILGGALVMSGIYVSKRGST
ncbi:MAG: DMT family transporter [Burkholderiaceae bacterium]